jgi:hypothetical protein
MRNSRARVVNSGARMVSSGARMVNSGARMLLSRRIRMVTLKLKRLEVPIEVFGGLLIKSIIEPVKVDRLTRIPMNQKQSRSLNESLDVLKALSI